MRVIGITGGTGCGKTSVLRMMERLGCFAVDADEVYHRLLKYDKQMLADMAEAFPEAVVNGTISRTLLGPVVYNDDEKMVKLKAITHPAVAREIEHILDVGRKHNATMAVIDAVFLFESGISELCDLTVGVVAPREVRKLRIMSRDGITEKQAEMRIDAQPDESFYRERCDYIIENSREDNSIHDKTVGFYDNLVNGNVIKKDKK